MKKEIECLLFARYPQLFAQYCQSIHESNDCSKLCCGDGWFVLINALCARLQFETDHNHAPQVVVTEVKEKMGELRVYTRHSNFVQYGMIEFATAMSLCICETCGNPGAPYNDSGTYLVRCAEHMPRGAIPVSLAGMTKPLGRRVGRDE